jgi:hypothetical protein
LAFSGSHLAKKLIADRIAKLLEEPWLFPSILPVGVSPIVFARILDEKQWQLFAWIVLL